MWSISGTILTGEIEIVWKCLWYRHLVNHMGSWYWIQVSMLRSQRLIAQLWLAPYLCCARWQVNFKMIKLHVDVGSTLVFFHMCLRNVNHSFWFLWIHSVYTLCTLVYPCHSVWSLIYIMPSNNNKKYQIKTTPVYILLHSVLRLTVYVCVCAHVRACACMCAPRYTFIVWCSVTHDFVPCFTILNCQTKITSALYCKTMCGA